MYIGVSYPRPVDIKINNQKLEVKSNNRIKDSSQVLSCIALLILLVSWFKRVLENYNWHHYIKYEHMQEE
jgi:hypothetical protein